MAFYEAHGVEYVIVCADQLNQTHYHQAAYEGRDTAFEIVETFNEVKVLRVRVPEKN